MDLTKLWEKNNSVISSHEHEKQYNGINDLLTENKHIKKESAKLKKLLNDRDNKRKTQQVQSVINMSSDEVYDRVTKPTVSNVTDTDTDKVSSFKDLDLDHQVRLLTAYTEMDFSIPDVLPKKFKKSIQFQKWIIPKVIWDESNDTIIKINTERKTLFQKITLFV